MLDVGSHAVSVFVMPPSRLVVPKAFCFMLSVYVHHAVCDVSMISPVCVDGFSPNLCQQCILGQR